MPCPRSRSRASRNPLPRLPADPLGARSSSERAGPAAPVLRRGGGSGPLPPPPGDLPWRCSAASPRLRAPAAGRGGADRREPEPGRGAGWRLSGAPWLRRGRRSAGRAGRAGALSSGLGCWSRPASRPRAAAGGRGRAGHGKPSARSPAALVAKPPLPARLASVLLSRPHSLTLSLPGWKFPLTSREQTDGRTHARAQRGREVGSPPGVGEARAPRPGAPNPKPRDAPGRRPQPKGRPEQLEAKGDRPGPQVLGTEANLICMSPPLGVSVTLRSLHRLNRNFEIVADLSPENSELIHGLGEVFGLFSYSIHRALSGLCDRSPLWM